MRVILPELMDQLVPFHPSKLHPDMSLRTCQQIPITTHHITTSKTHSILKIQGCRVL